LNGDRRDAIPTPENRIFRAKLDPAYLTDGMIAPVAVRQCGPQPGRSRRSGPPLRATRSTVRMSSRLRDRHTVSRNCNCSAASAGVRPISCRRCWSRQSAASPRARRVLVHLARVSVGAHDRLNLSGDAPKEVIIRSMTRRRRGSVHTARTRAVTPELRLRCQPLSDALTQSQLQPVSR